LEAEMVRWMEQL